MLLWVTFAVMTAAALAALLWPLHRRGSPEAGAREAELAVYRDQLVEIDRDAARGLIGIEEAEATRNEVARRMLFAAGSQDMGEFSVPSPSARRAAIVSALVGVPAVALSTYLALGRPDLPGLPRAERMALAVERSDMDAMVAQVEAHLADNPSDAQGWLVLAPAYRGMGRYGDAAEAFARAIEIAPPTANLLSDLGEALVLAEDGLVGARARDAFRRALALDAENVKALFYRGLAERQDGELGQALATWRSMLEDAPADAEWRPAVERQMASLEREPTMPQIGEQDIAKAQELDEGEREAMIRGMVDGLAERLEREGGDLQGWLRLARARMVLGEREEADAALRTAEHHFSGDVQSLGQIAKTRDALGLGGPGDEAIQ